MTALLLILLAISATAVGAAWVIHMAERIGLIDQPGHRRMHLIATPRGGGVGMASGLAALAIAQIWLPEPVFTFGLALTLALALVSLAVVGFLDDRGGLSIWSRLLTHFFAAAVLVSAIVLTGHPLNWLMLVVLIVVLAAATNLANFLDGINGILSLQVGFILLAAASLAVPGAYGSLCLAGGLGVLAFLPFNFPRARCFMGDVASGPLGFWTAAMLILGALAGWLDPLLAMLLPSAVLIDTGATLLSRVVAGKRFWRAHREHLYQWLVRYRWSVLQVNALYLGWNGLSLGLWFTIDDWQVSARVAAIAVFYLGGMVIWALARHRLLRVRRRRPQSSLGKRAAR